MLCGMANNTRSGRSHVGTPKTRSFGLAIREIREGLPTKPSLRAVATAIGIDPSQLSKIETGKSVPKVEVAKRILAYLGVVDDHEAELLKLLAGAETSPEEPWVATTLPEQRQHIAAIVNYEDDAREIVVWTLGVFPGLLQTKAYAHAVMSGGRRPLPASEVNIRVMTRLGRQTVLSPERERPTRLVAYVHEMALRQDIGGPKIFREQLEYLLKMMKRPNVDVFLVPDGVGWHEGLEGPFAMIEPHEDVDSYSVVFLEYRRSGLILHADEDVAAYRDAVESVQRLAMDASRTEAAIARAINEMRILDERT